MVFGFFFKFFSLKSVLFLYIRLAAFGMNFDNRFIITRNDLLGDGLTNLLNS